MTKPVITFFNNKGGVGKTSLVYHLAWMFAEQGARVVAADLDPQSNLTAAFLDEDELEVIWPFDGGEKTIYGAVGPLQRGVGDIGPAPLYRVSNKLDPSGEIALIPGDLRLSSFEDELSGQWPRCLSGDERAFRVVSAFSRLLQDAARQHDADFVLVDVGPNLGAINRAAMVATDFVVVPLAPDLFSLQGLRNLGPTLRKWRMEWRLRLDQAQVADLELPAGEMRPLGYVVLGHGVRLDRPVKSYQRWMEKIPGTFEEFVLENKPPFKKRTIETDPFCLSQLKHYHSLIPLGMEARKPVFALKPADGAFGGHAAAVQRAFVDFERLAQTVSEQVLNRMV